MLLHTAMLLLIIGVFSILLDVRRGPVKIAVDHHRLVVAAVTFATGQPQRAPSRSWLQLRR